MTIFDDKEREYNGFALESESDFSYINRSSREDVKRIRDLMEDWYSRYPYEHKDDLRIRLRSNMDRQFLSAFFELYLHELLIRLGYQVEIHPEIPNGGTKRPDFFVSKEGEEGFYLEAVLATDLSDAGVGAQKRMDEVYDALDEIKSKKFFIGLKIKGLPVSPVPKKRLKREIEIFVTSINLETVEKEFNENRSFPTRTFSFEDWELDYYAIPKPLKSRDKTDGKSVGIRMHMPEWIDSSSPIRDAILKKSTRYGVIGKPFVVAVNTLAKHCDETSIMEALFGKEKYIVSVNETEISEPRMVRDHNGAWYGPAGPQNTRVSAALIVDSLSPWSVAARTPVIYHNPWAQMPCQTAMTQLFHSVPDGNLMKTVPGLNALEIFKLEGRWPF